MSIFVFFGMTLCMAHCKATKWHTPLGRSDLFSRFALSFSTPTSICCTITPPVCGKTHNWGARTCKEPLSDPSVMTYCYFLFHEHDFLLRLPHLPHLMGLLRHGAPIRPSGGQLKISTRVVFNTFAISVFSVAQVDWCHILHGRLCFTTCLLSRQRYSEGTFDVVFNSTANMTNLTFVNACFEHTQWPFRSTINKSNATYSPPSDITHSTVYENVLTLLENVNQM